MRLRAAVVVVCAFGAIAGVAAAPAAADPGGVPAAPGTGCQRGFDLVSVGEVLEIATPGFEDAILAEDRNGDALLCLRLLPGPIPLFEPTFLYYDNRLPAGA